VVVMKQVAGILLGLFDPEDGDNMFLQYVG
jgi:hypothetical protein